MTKVLQELITMEEAIARAIADPNTPTDKEIQARYDVSVKEVEAEFPPDMPSVYLHLLPRKGRPKNGEKVRPIQAKAVRMPSEFWDEFQSLASSDGVTIHYAMRVALMDWVAKRHGNSKKP